MIILAITQARIGSTRLPEKILKTIKVNLFKKSISKESSNPN